VAKCYDIVKDIQFPFPFAETIYQHHELLDGSGYPRRLKADQIILEARILTISDVLEAMTHHRPYRQAVGVEAAGRELTEGRGVKYDSKIVDIVFALIAENGGKAFWMNGT
jgi:HD-GYP domain-containing protein (c-di-GMP phosphodiesterase class II)